jgi:hypothetical protein
MQKQLLGAALARRGHDIRQFANQHAESFEYLNPNGAFAIARHKPGRAAGAVQRVILFPTLWEEEDSPAAPGGGMAGD